LNQYQEYKGQILGATEEGFTRQLKCGDDGVLQTSISSGNNLIGATMTHGDVPMVLVDTTRETPIGSVLGANAVYISPVVDRPEQSIPDGYMRIWALSDQSGTLYLEESNQSSSGWTTTATVVVSAGVSNIMTWTKLTKRYSRCRYVNGATPQASFIMLHYMLGVGVTPIRVEDGDIVTIGTKNDTAVIDPTASGSVNANLKGIMKSIQGSAINSCGIVNVTTAGTRVQLPNIPCREVTIIAKRLTTGYIYAGNNAVSAASYGVELAAKESFTFAVANANQVYIDASVSGEGISYVAI